MTCARKSSECPWISMDRAGLSSPWLPGSCSAAQVLTGVPESAPSLPRVLCQGMLSFPKLVGQLESALPGRCALLGADGSSRAIGIQESPCPLGIHQSWPVYPCWAGGLCAQMVQTHSLLWVDVLSLVSTVLGKFHSNFMGCWDFVLLLIKLAG